MQCIARQAPYKDSRLRNLCLNKFKNSANITLVARPQPPSESEWKSKFSRLTPKTRPKLEPFNVISPVFDLKHHQSPTTPQETQTIQRTQATQATQKPAKKSNVYKPKESKDSLPDSNSSKYWIKALPSDIIKDESILTKVFTPPGTAKEFNLKYDNLHLIFRGIGVYRCIMANLICDKYDKEDLQTKTQLRFALTSDDAVMRLYLGLKWENRMIDKPTDVRTIAGVFYAYIAGIIEQYGMRRGLIKAYDWIKERAEPVLIPAVYAETKSKILAKARYMLEHKEITLSRREAELDQREAALNSEDVEVSVVHRTLSTPRNKYRY